MASHTARKIKIPVAKPAWAKYTCTWPTLNLSWPSIIFTSIHYAHSCRIMLYISLQDLKLFLHSVASRYFMQDLKKKNYNNSNFIQNWEKRKTNHNLFCHSGLKGRNVKMLNLYFYTYTYLITYKLL